MDRHIVSALDHAARLMHRQATLEETLRAVVDAARETMPLFDHVGISLVRDGGTIVTPAATTELVTELDHLQYSLHQGPCWDTVNGEEIVVAPSIRHDQRWPAYVAPAVRRGLRSQLAVRLHLDEDRTVGGLNLYSTTSESIPDDHVLVASLFATHAATALGAARRTDTLTEALETRSLIGRAIGILMERYDLTPEAARAFLWRASSHSNTKVKDLATQIVTDVAERRSRRTSASADDGGSPGRRPSRP